MQQSLKVLQFEGCVFELDRYFLRRIQVAMDPHRLVLALGFFMRIFIYAPIHSI